MKNSEPRRRALVPRQLRAFEVGVGKGELLLIEFALPNEANAAREPLLSAAEQHVLRLILRGSSNAEIARQRNTSTRTVANQIQSIFKKMGVGSRAELSVRVTNSNSE